MLSWAIVPLPFFEHGELLVKLEILKSYGMIILRWMFRKLEGVVRTGRSWLRRGTGGGHL
jgi:hypothetical protein